MSISRRDILKTLTIGAVGGSVLRIIPAEAAAFAHHMVHTEKATAKNGVYTPKFFSAHDYKSLQSLCGTIIPADAECAGAVEAGAPEFIDLITSENKQYQLAFGGGIMWLDTTCTDRYGKAYLECSAEQQKEFLDLIAYRKNVVKDSSLSPGVEFFSLLRRFTADGFFTSEIGIQYVGYVGNKYLLEWPGCPPVPGL